MTTASEVLAIAAREIGYSRWDDKEAGTRYGRWYAQKVGDASFGNSGVPFCAMGVSWVLDQAGMTPPGGIFAYVPYGINNAKALGRLVPARSAQPGDLVCFDWNHDGLADHVAFVELNRGSCLQTVEFNTTSGVAGSQGNGGGVYRRTRAWDVVCAVIRPAYTNAATIPSGTVSGYQTIPDGWWGKNTTRDLQRSRGTSVDAVVSGQPPANRSAMQAATSGWEWVQRKGGSQLITSMQQDMKAAGQYRSNIDGWAGPEFANGLERRHGIAPDRVLSGPSESVRRMQLSLAKTGRF